MVGSWTFCHGRNQPYPRRAPGETALNGYSSMELAPLDAHMPSDAEIWTGMLGLPLPVRERFSAQLDITAAAVGRPCPPWSARSR